MDSDVSCEGIRSNVDSRAGTQSGDVLGVEAMEGDTAVLDGAFSGRAKVGDAGDVGWRSDGMLVGVVRVCC